MQNRSAGRDHTGSECPSQSLRGLNREFVCKLFLNIFKPTVDLKLCGENKLTQINRCLTAVHCMFAKLAVYNKDTLD